MTSQAQSHGTHVERAPRASPQEAPGRAASTPLASEPSQDYQPTEVTTPEGILGQLEPDDLALVVTCCAMSSHRAPELLELVDPCRSSRLSQAAKGIAGLERRERISLFARHLSPPLTCAAIDTTIRALRNEPAWLAALACRSLPAQAREPLLYSAEIREAWEEKRAPHPAVESYARRLSSRLLEG